MSTAAAIAATDQTTTAKQSPGLAEALDVFLRYLEGQNRSAATIQAYRADLTQFLGWRSIDAMSAARSTRWASPAAPDPVAMLSHLGGHPHLGRRSYLLRRGRWPRSHVPLAHPRGSARTRRRSGSSDGAAGPDVGDGEALRERVFGVEDVLRQGGDPGAARDGRDDGRVGPDAGLLD